MPGAQLIGHEGDEYLGKVKVKAGPVTSEFSGKCTLSQDRNQHRAVFDASARGARYLQRGCHGRAQLYRGRRAYPRHRRHRSEDCRQTGAIRQWYAAAGVGEAGPKFGIC